MSGDSAKMTISVTRTVSKFAEGDDPKTATPFEVINHPVVLKGEEALQLVKKVTGALTDEQAVEYLKQMEAKSNGTN